MSEEDEGLCLWHVLATLWGVYTAYPEPFKGKTESGYSRIKESLSSRETSYRSIPQLTGFYKPALNVLACSVVHQWL